MNDIRETQMVKREMNCPLVFVSAIIDPTDCQSGLKFGFGLQRLIYCFVLCTFWGVVTCEQSATPPLTRSIPGKNKVVLLTGDTGKTAVHKWCQTKYYMFMVRIRIYMWYVLLLLENVTYF